MSANSCSSTTPAIQVPGNDQREVTEDNPRVWWQGARVGDPKDPGSLCRRGPVQAFPAT